MMIVVNLQWDEEANVYFATSNDMTGLALESESCENLIKRCQMVVPELLKLNNELPNDEKILLRFIFECELN